MLFLMQLADDLANRFGFAQWLASIRNKERGRPCSTA
jgi:hypothetical protein